MKGKFLPPTFPSSLSPSPTFPLGFSETFDPEKRIGSRFGKAETNQLPFEGVESDKKSEGMPGLTDPKPARCSDGLKDER